MRMCNARDKSSSQETLLVIQMIHEGDTKEGSPGGGEEAGDLQKYLGAKLLEFANGVKGQVSSQDAWCTQLTAIRNMYLCSSDGQLSAWVQSQNLSSLERARGGGFFYCFTYSKQFIMWMFIEVTTSCDTVGQDGNNRVVIGRAKGGKKRRRRKRGEEEDQDYLNPFIIVRKPT